MPSEYTTHASPWPVAETVRRFTAVLAERGVTIFATIDQRAAARDAGLELRETILILFGNPRAGTPVMDAVPLAAVDLPLKVLIWDDGGQTRVAYLAPAALLARHGIPETLGGPLGAIDALVGAALTI